MARAHPDLVRRLFDEAMDLPGPLRAEFVRRGAGGDVELELDVLSLVEAADRSADGFERDAVEALAGSGGGGAAGDSGGGERARDEPGVLPGEPVWIGGYRVVRTLGSGGMATVFEAEQEQPRRTVALKVMHAWKGSAGSRRRFVEEAQTLARLLHPGVAQVYAAGVHDLGVRSAARAALDAIGPGAAALPWLAMELVPGAMTITAYAERHGLSVRRRLELMAEVCDAVHHGHVRGVIHRDLKPANILVGTDGRPKVIDFGVAMVAAGDAGGVGGVGGAGEAHAAGLTVEGAVLGTVRYMSPEQCAPGARDVDVRSDVYALGVVLYELLTGRVPCVEDGADALAAMTAIRTIGARRPSERVRGLRGDVDTIVLKALEKDRERRYQSAADLAGDLRRFLRHEPIMARPTGVVYRTTKLARRNPLAASMLGVAVVAGLVAVGGLAVGVVRERAARREAERLAYLASIAAADSALRAGDGGSARARLDAAPVGMRGWEWRFLRGLADRSASATTVRRSFARLAVAPDGRAMYRVTMDGAIVASTPDAAGEFWRLEGEEPFGDVRLDGRGERLAVGWFNRLMMIDTLRGRVLWDVPVVDSLAPMMLKFAPRGPRLVAGALTGACNVGVWDVDDGRLVATVPVALGWTYGLDFSPDGARLAVNQFNTETVVYDTSTWAPVARMSTYRLGPDEWNDVDFSPDGKWLAITTGLTIEIRDSRTGELDRVLRGHTQRIMDVEFEPSGRRLASCSYDRTVRLWDLDDGANDRVLLGHEGMVVRLGWFSVDEGRGGLWSSDESGVVRTWDMRAAVSTDVLVMGPERLPVVDLSFDDEGRELWAWAAGRVQVWDQSTHAARQVGTTAMPMAAVHAPTGSIARFDRDDGLVIERRGAAAVRVGLPRGTWWIVRFSPDGRVVAATDASGRMVMVHVGRGEIVQERVFTSAMVANTFMFSPRSDWMLAPNEDGRLHVLRLDDEGRATAEFVVDASDGDLLCGAISNDGRWLAVGGTAETVDVYEVGTWRWVRRLEGINSTVWSLAFSPDDRRLAVGSQDRLVRVFDAGTWDQLLQLRGHTGTVRSLVWSGDGRRLASGAHDNAVRVWDAGSRDGDRTPNGR